MANYNETLHKYYSTKAMELARCHYHGDTSVARQIDEFSRLLALSMWAEFGVSFEECRAAVNQIYSSANAPTPMSDTEIKRVMADRDFHPDRKIPKFFSSLVRDDIRHNRVHSRMFAEEYQDIVIMFAMIDYDISPEEANYINKYFDFLSTYCDNEGVIKAYNSFNANDRVNSASTLERKYSMDAPTQSKSQKPAAESTAESEPAKEAAPAEESVEPAASAIEDLHAMIGLDTVKDEIEGIANFARIQKMRKEQGLNCAPMSYHLVFTGNPGTGKTTVARIVARIYKELGLLSKGHLVEVDRGGLVAGYVGQTATKTKEVLTSAMGGVLFIDEAYTLASEDDKGFGQEAIDTILKTMEDSREDLVVVVAGYDNLMENFINSNPGLRSRFTRYIHFPDYKPEELLAIFMQNVDKNQYRLARGVKTRLKNYFTELYNNRDENFGNGRTVRTYFEQVITNQANRLAQESSVDKDDLMTIKAEDL